MIKGGEILVREYECPSCGATMVFDSASQKMLCKHCGTQKTVQEMEGLLEENKQEVDYHTGEQASFRRYTCKGCGAEILTDDYTAATFCSFCGNPTLIEDRLSGEKTPAQIIPFKINKEQAQNMYQAWCKKGPLTPSDFTSKTTIEKITGMYVPFWLYDYTANAKIGANCTRVSRERRGDMEYTHTDHYYVHRDVSDFYKKIPVDASEKMPDDVMDKLEPFSYGEIKDFDMGYLSGFMAERYNFTSDEMKKRAEKRVKEYILRETKNTIQGYSTTVITEQNVRLNCKEASYAMLPVWLLNYRYKGKDYLFTLNGQTGKIVGTLPISKGKMAVWFGGVTAVVYLLLTLVGGILG